MLLRRIGICAGVCACLMLAACQAAGGSSPVLSPASTRAAEAPTPTAVEPQNLAALPTLTPTPTNMLPTNLPPTPSPSATAAAPQVCSPLVDVSLAELPGMISNPYYPPPLGSDDPHQGVDLSDRHPGSQVALAGRGVQAALAGRVVALIEDRFPYGNAVLIESPLADIPAPWLQAQNLPQAIPTLPPHPALTCPDGPELLYNPDERSFYFLYAHLQSTAGLQLGDTVACGQELGKVGDSGNALNPHLHLEVRLGPAGASFAGLAHYDNRATPVEMANYCTWRVSGWFLAVDPLLLLSAR